MADEQDRYAFIKMWIGDDERVVSKIDATYLKSLGDLVGHLLTDSEVDEHMKEYQRHDTHITESEIKEQILKAVVEQIATYVRANYIEKTTQ